MIAQFALRLLCGISLIWLLLPRERITAGFFRIQMLLALALAVFAAITTADGTGFSSVHGGSAGTVIHAASLVRVLCGILAGVAFAGSVAWTLKRRSAGTICIYLVAGLSTTALLVCSVSANTLMTPIGVLTICSELSSALLIGGATAGMLLGHWYLTAPTMAIEPLHRANAYFASAAVVRLLSSSVGLWFVWPALSGGTPALWLTLRWLAGILSPLLLAAMTGRILKYRNTQAATGVLFVGVIVTFIGELSATLASRELGIPL